MGTQELILIATGLLIACIALSTLWPDIRRRFTHTRYIERQLRRRLGSMAEGKGICRSYATVLGDLNRTSALGWEDVSSIQYGPQIRYAWVRLASVSRHDDAYWLNADAQLSPEWSYTTPVLVCAPDDSPEWRFMIFAGKNYTISAELPFGGTDYARRAKFLGYVPVGPLA